MKPLSIALLGAFSLVACRSGEAPRGRRVTEAAPLATTTAAPAAAAATAKPAPAAAQATGNKDPSSTVAFPDAIDWQTWEEGLRLAKAQNKPIMVVVYADWCPKCRALSPVFASPEVSGLAKGLIVVRQNNDEAPAWLQSYNEKYGGYVPRIFFFDPQGKLREDVTSGHPRYPYFYAAQQPDFLMKSMRQAIGS